MNTLTDIQAAVSRLSSDDQKALREWLNSQAEATLTSSEEEQLLCSLDEAIRDVNANNGVPINEVRKRMISWTKS